MTHPDFQQPEDCNPNPDEHLATLEDHPELADIAEMAEMADAQLRQSITAALECGLEPESVRAIVAECLEGIALEAAMTDADRQSKFEAAARAIPLSDWEIAAYYSHGTRWAEAVVSVDGRQWVVSALVLCRPDGEIVDFAATPHFCVEREWTE